MPRTLSVSTLKVLALLARGSEMHGKRVCDLTGVSIGIGYAILHALQRDGLLDSRAEHGGTARAWRDRRVLYQINAEGRRVMDQLRELVAAAA